MRNEEVYRVTKTRTLTIYITKARWKLQDHVLRLNENTPFRKAMKHLFVKPSALVKKRKILSRPEKHDGKKKQTGMNGRKEQLLSILL